MQHLLGNIPKKLAIGANQSVFTTSTKELRGYGIYNIVRCTYAF